MKMQLETSVMNLISHYGPGVIRINDQEYTSNILVTADGVTENWFNGSIDTLAAQHFAPLVSLPADKKPEVVLLGTGSNHVFPSMKLLAELRAQGLVVEVMNTRAACRTYSVLIGEDRIVAAALIQIDP